MQHICPVRSNMLLVSACDFDSIEQLRIKVSVSISLEANCGESVHQPPANGGAFIRPKDSVTCVLRGSRQDHASVPRCLGVNLNLPEVPNRKSSAGHRNPHLGLKQQHSPAGTRNLGCGKHNVEQEVQGNDMDGRQEVFVPQCIRRVSG